MVKKLEVDSWANPKPHLLFPPFCRNIPAAAVLTELLRLSLSVA